MIKVNIDYESVLFHGQIGSTQINQSLEFLAFFLQDQPILTARKYSPEYLAHVSKISGVTPRTSESGKASNWWGPLKDLEEERFLNSKITSTELSISHRWVEAKIIQSPEELAESYPENYFFKDPFSMSGRGFRPAREASHLTKFPQILEPILPRRYDFSHYIFPDGRVVAYENKVDEKFQYKGTRFQDWRNPTVENFSFYGEVSQREWNRFHERLRLIQDFYRRPTSFGYSVDSFIYENNIYPLCEVNYRRTMGWIAYELSARYAQDFPWTQFLIQKAQKDFYKKVARENVLVLSPGDTRFDFIFIRARNEEEGLLSLRELAIEI
jgi:hypothetical protein